MLKRLLFAVLLLCACAAEAAVYSLPWGPKPQFIDANGAPMSGGSISTFQAGSSTPQVTYTTQVGNVANSTTITLNVRGETPNEVWLTGGLTYKLVLKDSSGSTVWTVDNVSGVNDPTAAAIDEWKASGLTPTYVSATSFTFPGDQTVAFHAGRRIKTTNSGGTIYSTIQSATFAPNTTTVTVLNDTGILDAGLSAVSYAILSYNNRSIPSFIASGTGAIVRPIIGCTLNGKLCEVVSVKDFGAKCDGATDDTAAIQAAITAVGAAGGGTVSIPAGTCMVSAGSGVQGDALIISSDNVELAGAGMYATTLKNLASSRATVVHAYKGVYPGANTIIKNVVVRDLGIDGNQANITHNGTDTYENGINFDFCQNCRAERNYVRNVVFQGILFQGSSDTNSKNNIARGNVVTAFGEVGIGLEGGTHDSSIDGNIIYGGITVAEVAGGSVGILVSQILQTGYGNKVVNNLVDSTPADCVRVQDGSAYASVASNTLRNCGTTSGAGITVNGNTTSPNHVSIVGNVLTAASSNGAAAIQVNSTSTAVGFASVVGNKIADTAGGGVLLNSGKNGSVVGNRITNCGTGAGTVTSGVRLAGSTATPHVSGNYVDSCAGAGVEVLAGTTDAIVLNNVLLSNGSTLSDSGTRTVSAGLITASPGNYPFNSGMSFKRTTPTYGVTVAIDASLGNEFDITVTDAVGFTISNPTNSVDGSRITITVRNTSGGAMGVITWGANFRLAAFANPANGSSRSIEFKYNGGAWVELSRTAADVPN